MSCARWIRRQGDFVDVEDVNNVNPLKPTITQTYEVGYKGIVLNKFAFSADVYHSRIKDFVGSLGGRNAECVLGADNVSCFAE